MTARLPTGRRGQALALGITAAGLGVFWLGIAAPLIDWYAARQAALAGRATLAAHMQAIAATVPALRRAASLAAPTTALLLPDDSDALAAARLQGTVNRLAAAAGVTPTSLETLPAESKGGLRRVGLRVALTAPWPRLVDMLLEIRHAQPRMLLDDLELRGLPVRSRTEAVPIDADFAVYAFRATGP